MKGMLLGLAGWLVFASMEGRAEPVFRVDFEDTLQATQAAGSAEGQADAAVEYVEGLDGKAAVLGNSHRLRYAAKDNIKLDAGTILMWIKPLNWDWQTEKFVEFLRLDEPNDRSTLLLYKYTKPGAEFGLVWLAGLQRKDGEKALWTTAKEPIKATGAGQWMLLAATWDQSAKLIHLYVNGEQAAYAKTPADKLPKTLAESFFILNTTKTPKDDEYRTAVDSLVIEDRALSEQDIRSYYEKTRGALAAVPTLDAAKIPASLISLPKLTTAPEIDGHYGANEWGEAATASGFSVFAQPRTPADRQTTVHVGYDDKYLYVAWLTPIPPGKPAVAAADGRDDLKIGRDDAVELIISPEGRGTYQWLNNTKNVSADLKGAHFAKLDKEWNSQAKVSGKVYEARWLCEMAIPLEELGGVPQAGQRWGINFCRDWAQAAESGRALATAWSFAHKSFASDLGAAVFRPSGVTVGMTLDPKAMEERRLAGQFDIRNSAGQPVEGLRVVAEIVSATGEVVRSEPHELKIAAGQQVVQAFDLAVEVPTALGRFRVTTASGEEIYQHSVPLEYPAGVVISPLVRAESKSVEVHVQLGGVKIEPDSTAQVTLRDKSGKTLARAPLDLGKNKTGGTALLALEGIADGDYDLIAEVLTGGQTTASATRAFEIMLDPVWLKERPGISRRVLPPWTPMTVQDSRVNCWGRTYEFGKSLLPVQIRSAEEDLLVRPAWITAETSTPNDPEPVELSMVEAADDRVVVEARQEGAAVTLSTRTTIEYDGMTKVKLTVTPKAPGTRLDRLQIDLPLWGFREPLLHAHSFAWSDMIRKRLPADFHNKFFPYLWVGSEERGLAWFAESDQNWRNARTDDAMALVTKDGGIDWRVTLVDEPVELSEPVTYVFGLQATPVKAPLAQRRALRLHQLGMTHILPWAMKDKSLKKYQPEDREWGWLAPQVGNYEGFRTEIDAWREKGISLPVYVAPTITSPRSPSYQLYKESWRNPHGSYPFACAGASFTDELIWNVDQMIKRSGMESIYIDCAWAYSCGNQGHGCGYKAADGKTRLTYPIFALREELKRIYTLIHHPDATKRALVWAHASGLAAAPIHSFVDVLTQGEEVRTEITAHPDYLDIYSLDDWRITYGPSLGIEMNFLPEFADPSVKEARYSPEKNATFVSLALLHDTSLQDGFSDPAYLKKVYETLDKEGFRSEDVKFLPYWSQDVLTAPKGSGVEVSVYALPTHSLAVVLNPTAKPASVQLTAKPAAKAGEIFPKAQTIDLTNPVEIPAKNFVIYKLTP